VGRRLVIAGILGSLVACVTAATSGNPSGAISEPVPMHAVDRIVIDGGEGGLTIIVESIDCIIFQSLYFAPGTSSISEASEGIIESWARALNSDEQIELVEISAMADPKEKNAVALADARAQAGRLSLLAKGVAPSRVRARGYGAYCAEPASDPGASERNRTAHIKVVVSRGAPTGVELGCESARRAGLVPTDLSSKGQR
jgi:OmpA-OmpF porin, OOP family